MNKIFHQTAPIIALKFMPKEFQEFMLSDGFTEDKIKEISDLPDLVDHDNIESDPLCRHDHSWKLEMNKDEIIHFKDGNAVGRIKNLAIDAHDFYAEKNNEMVKYSLSKMTHYIVDSQTFPHNFVGNPWSKHHEPFETEMGGFIQKHINILLTKEFTFTKCDDIYKYCSKIARDRWHLGKDIVGKYESNIKLTDDEKMEICISCIQAIGDIWLTIANALKINK